MYREFSATGKILLTSAILWGYEPEKNLLSGSGKSNAGLSEESLGRQQKPLEMTELFLRRNILKGKNKRKTILVKA